MPEYDRVKMQLWQQLDDLLRRVTKIEGDMRAIYSQDWVERATEAENDDVLAELDETSRRQVAETREALQRIERGHYGICTRCSQSISSERLEALPTTATCVTCAALA